MGFIKRLLREQRDREVQTTAAIAEASLKRQHKIAEDIRRRGISRKPGKHMQHRMIIDPVQVRLLQKIHGDKCFADPEFVSALERDNPMMRVPR